jgi:hypothetical protein
MLYPSFIVRLRPLAGVLCALLLVTLLASPVQAVSAAISRQPQNTTLEISQTLRLSVEYIGAAPLSVNWTRNDQIIPNATSTNLIITNVAVTNSGTYRANLVYAGTTLTSDPASVSVNHSQGAAVGFITLTIEPGFQLVTFQLLDRVTVAQALGALPAGVTIYKMDGNGFRANNYFNGWSDPDMTIAMGEAFFVHNATSTPATITITGSLAVGQLMTQIPEGFSAFGSMIPLSGQLYTIFDASFSAPGTILYGFNKTTQSFIPHNWGGGESAPSFAVGEAWICYSPHIQTAYKQFDLSFPFSQPSTSSTLLVLPPLRPNPAQFYFSTFGSDDAFGRILEIDGSRPVKGLYTAQVYLGLVNDESALQAVGKPVATLNRTYNGRVQGKLVDVPSRSGGENVYAQLRVWETSYGSTYETAVQNGGRHGKSAVTPYIVRSVIENDQPSLPPLPFANFPSFPIQLGTDKTTRLTDIAPAAGGIKLWFIAEQGKNYRILYKDGFQVANWTTLPGAESLPGNNGEVTFIDPTATPHRFYRIQQLP